MKTSNIGLDLIKHFESLHDGDLKQIGLQPKMCPSGVWTEGWGNAIFYKGKLLKGIENKKLAYSLSKIKTKEQADLALLAILPKYEKIVTDNIKIPLKQNQFDALVSHTYNTGGSNGLFELINNKADKKDIEFWFLNKYITGGGVVWRGLIARRKSEAKLYFHE